MITIYRGKKQIKSYLLLAGKDGDGNILSSGASVLTGLNEKHSKIKGFRQSINGINLKIKYFSFQNTLRY